MKKVGRVAILIRALLVAFLGFLNFSQAQPQIESKENMPSPSPSRRPDEEQSATKRDQRIERPSPEPSRQQRSPQTGPRLITDASGPGLNVTAVDGVIRPKTTEQIQEAVINNDKISVGGARHTMGGHTASDGALFIDMRGLNKIIGYSPDEKEITVQAGATWRQIQEFIDRDDLSLKNMQSYANFTVGGSLSANAHGRYVGEGSLIDSVKSIKVVLADGSVVEASRTENPEIFYSAIGGYGGIGIIVEATLELRDNVNIKRHTQVMSLDEYNEFFLEYIKDNPRVVLAHADIYPTGYQEVRVVVWLETDEPPTIADRLVPLDPDEFQDSRELMEKLTTKWGQRRRQRQDWKYYQDNPVTTLNYEASYHTAELPSSNRNAAYILQEYFVPEHRFDEFADEMGDILLRNDVQVINVSIRHAEKDSESLLSWAPNEDVFSFVIYYKQGTTPEEKKKTEKWTRDLIDSALDNGGTFYLPYQKHATEEQFRRGYENSGKFFDLKRELDPEGKFDNKFLEEYDPERQ